MTIAAVALVCQPLAFRSPRRLVGLPHVFATAGEPEGLESHRLQRHVAGENHAGRPRRFSGHTSA